MKVELRSLGIIVRDMKKSLEFYRQVGLDIPEGVENQPHVDIIMDDEFIFFWDTVELAKQWNPNFSNPQDGNSRLVVEFRLSSPAEVDAKYAELTEQGYQGHRQPFDAPWQARFAMVNDPDGNTISIFAPL